MLDQTLTQILNELYRLTASLQQAAQDINTLEKKLAAKDKEITELEGTLNSRGDQILRLLEDQTEAKTD